MSRLLTRVMRRLGYTPIRAQRNAWFPGAAVNRLTSDWITMGGGPNQELMGSLGALRDRARDLERNNPLVRRYLNLLAENVIGRQGVTLQAHTGSRRNDQRIEDAWSTWGQAIHYSADGRMGRAEFERHLVRSVARDGEAFVRLRRRGDYGLSCQALDPALVDDTFSRAATADEPAVKLGVELDADDRPLAYHVLSAHRYDVVGGGSVTRVRVPAEEMIHLYQPRRAGQVRGESWLAPVLLPLRMLDGYTEAELVAARTAAQKMGFISRAGDDLGPGPDPSESPRREMESAPGVIDYLEPGEEFREWDPKHPSQNFAAFATEIVRMIAMGLNVSAASLGGNMGEANFAQGRIGLLQERDSYRTLQQWFIAQWCEPVYTVWRQRAWLSGKLALRMTPDQYNTHLWQPRGFGYTNPREERVADMLAIAAGFTSPQRVVAAAGDDLEEIYREIAIARELAESYGVDRFTPNSVVPYVDGDSSGTTASQHGDQSGRSDDAGRGRRHDPGLALFRAAS